jgi:hypothetical protein
VKSSPLLIAQSKTINSCRSADENSCAFRLFIPFLTSVSLLETIRLSGIVTPRADS